MIFVTTGTYGFTKLVMALDKITEAKLIDNEFYIQIGLSNYKPRACKWIRSLPCLDETIDKADFVISHGGATVLEILARNKALIGVPNTELSDNHQYFFLKELYKRGSIIFCPSTEADKIIEAINRLKSFRYNSNIIDPFTNLRQKIIADLSLC
jgi:UDP-N-acetylglucosamine transferase subunit ALG13